MNQENTVPDNAQLAELVRKRAEVEAAIQAVLGNDVDAVIDPLGGTPILLQHAQSELLQLREELEHRIEERTAALQRANEELQATNEELVALNEELALTEETVRRQHVELEEAGREIERERAHYQTLFDLAPDGYLITDAAGTIQEANVAAGTLFGEAPDRLPRRRLAEFVYDADGRMFQDQVHYIRTQQRPRGWRWEMRVQPTAGRPFHAAVTAAPVHDRDGELTAIRWLVRDVSERKLAEAALVASEERFRLVADFTHDWEYWSGSDGQYIYVSPSVERLTGYRPQEFFEDAELMQRMVHPDDRPLLEQHALDKERQPGVHRVDLRIVTRSGDVRWIGHVCQPVYREDGTWLGMRGSNRDITDQKQAQARQRELLDQVRTERDVTTALAARIEREWNLLETIMDNTATGLAYLDPTFDFVRVNPAYATSSGYHPAELIGRNHFVLFPNDENRAIFERVRDSGEAIEFKARAFEDANRPERGVTYWDWALVPVKDQVGQVRGLVLSLTEVTDRVHATRQQAEHLARLDALLDFTHDVVAEQTVEGLLERVIDAARALTGGRIGTAGHGYRSGKFVISASSRARDAPQCPEGEAFYIERGGVYVDILDSADPIRLTAEMLQTHPSWLGLPEQHVPLRGLLGARLVDRLGQGDGVIMVTDKEGGGDFSAEDAAVLGQLAAMASLALQHIEARHAAERQAAELDAVFEAMANAVIVVDGRGIVTKTNRAFVELYAGDPVGHDWIEFLSALRARQANGQPVDLASLAATRALAGETVRDLRFTITDRSGKDRTILVSGGPLRNDGEVTGAVVVWHDITRLEQAERARDQLIAILEETPDMVSTSTLDGTIRYYNRAVRRVLGMPDDADASAFTIRRGHPGWSGDIVEQEAIPAAVRDGVWTGRTAVLRHDGVEIPVSQTILAHRGPGGEVEYLSTVARDMSHEVAMMAQLEAERARLKAILDNAPEGIVVADGEGRILFTNPAGDRLYVHPEPSTAPQGERASFQLCDSDGKPYAPHDLPIIRSALDGETFRDLEMSIVWSDGQRRYLLTNTAPILGSEGQLSGAVGVFQDITERIEMQAALRRARDKLEERVVERTRELRDSEERFRQLAEHIEDVFWLVDPVDGRLLYVSPAYETVWGRPVAELYRSPEALLDAVHPEDQERVLSLFGNVDYGFEHEFRILRPDGSERWIRSRAFPVRDESGSTYRVAGIADDVTRHKLAQLAMIKTERLSMAGQMAASLAHEINNPLQGATGCLELMREAIDDGEDPSQYVDVAREALQRAGRTVSQLRALHRGPLVEEKEATDVNALIEESLVLMHKKAAAQEVDLDWAPGSNLPPIELMRDGMHQVFLNLILNALDVMPDGGRLKVYSERVDRPLGVRVVFSDTGPGVAPEIIDRLFEPFQTTKPQGTGLGLFISQNTVERHGGRIDAESTDQGATFTVWLPA